MHPFDRAIAASLPLVPRPVVRHFADRYMAGETLEDAVATVRRLNDEHVMATVDVLGEFIRAPEEAEATATGYERERVGEALGAWHRARSRPRRPHARARAGRR